MDPRLKRKRDLEATIAADYDILKDLEDTLRYEDDPIRRAKLRREIQDLSNEITARQTELGSLSVQLRGTAVGLADEVQDYLVLDGWHVLGDWTMTAEGNVQLSIERRQGLVFQRVLVRCTADEADYVGLKRLHRTCLLYTSPSPRDRS